MNDLLPTLAERLQAVVDATYADNYKVVVGERLADVALAFVAERLPKTPAEVIAMMPPGTVVCEEPWNGGLLVFLRDLRGRLGVKP